ncbi:STM4015 family protein [Yinghuangia seranimata]|uniref:STM4015 family protein n=1 Tax=Yinghuangia seranimata TaxID=408067 RepID=UPI00248BB7CB|nr:STM4015 family protein [Yinghuangia seranimata]MDI2131549.1 STM4015 family protein [Yinghuangia seranimata]
MPTIPYTRGLLESFGGLPVAAFAPHGEPQYDWYIDPADVRPETGLPPADKAAWRLRTLNDDYATDPEDYPSLYARFVDTVDTTKVTALVIGGWGPSYEEASADVPLGLLTADAQRFPALRHLFVGDISQEEEEVSWIVQDDLTPLLNAFPDLHTLGVKGGSHLRLDAIRHVGLRELVFHSGGLPGHVLEAVGACELPALTHLYAMLGHPEYGGIDTVDRIRVGAGLGGQAGTVDQLAGILSGAGLPALTHLALCDSLVQDAVAATVAGAPVVARLAELDLSMGTLGDEGAEALLAGQPLGHLTRLDLHHHFIGDALQERLRTLCAEAGVDLDLSDHQTARDWGRYVAVAE